MTKTHPGSETQVKERNALALNPEPKKHALTLKPVPKKHTLVIGSETVKEIYPGSEIRAKRLKRASERNIVWP